MPDIEKYVYFVKKDGLFKRIPWDYMICGNTRGFAPAPIGTNFDDNLFDNENEISKIVQVLTVDTEDEFLEDYDKVNYFYESNDAQTWETDYPRE